MDTELPQRRVVFQGRKIDLALQAVPTADGRIAEREVVVHGGAVALLVLVDDDHLALVWNHRYTVGKTLLEVPAGTLDPGETPEETARRELKEETGYRARRIRPLAQWYVSPGVMTERMYLFACEDVEPGPPEHQPDERLELTIVSWDDALAMVADGRIEDAKTILALLIGQRELRKG